ncbi:uncharacterized protein LOC143590207 [Bidens hawaiensis]|uniref:uncharacterized protein LOC143590207 n=1 Tax=Bidens hawaiensis TaxID=980011 RepID=UPI004049524E
MEGARIWFDSLEPGSIDSYEELRGKFLRNFSQQRKAMKNPNKILHIRRRDDEKVEQFMDRYVTESMNIKGVLEVMKISGFINGLRFSQLTEKLGEDFPTTFDKLMDRVWAFVRGKDTGTKLIEWETKRIIPKGGSGGNFGGGLSPGKGRSSFKKGHTTKNCVQLKKLWEATLKSGQLPLSVPKESLTKVKNEDDDRHFVDMIRRREEEGDDLMRHAKLGRLGHWSGNSSWMKASISFPGLEEDEAHEMPLNISASVAGHRVARNHVDGGSGVEVMYKHCFTRLQEEVRSRLEEDICPLMGFSEEVVEPLGSLTLPITLRDGERTRTVNLQFLVVLAPSKYNIILGRPGMKAFRAVAFTIHGYLRFPTSMGVATVRSSAKIVASIGKCSRVKKIQPGTQEWVLKEDHPE